MLPPNTTYWRIPELPNAALERLLRRMKSEWADTYLDWLDAHEIEPLDVDYADVVTVEEANEAITAAGDGATDFIDLATRHYGKYWDANNVPQLVRLTDVEPALGTEDRAAELVTALRLTLSYQIAIAHCVIRCITFGIEGRKEKR